MKLKFFGAAGTVTGSCYYVETGETTFLVDCGMFQGSKEIKERNYGEFPFNPAGIDFLLLTHSHIDHSGLIPKLYKKGFNGKIYTTKATKDLCSIMLPDSGHIQEMEVERKNRKLKRAGRSLLQPIYTEDEARDCLRHFKSIKYDEKISPGRDVECRFRDAGHIFGSAMIEVWIGKDTKTKLLFSGDIGNINQPIVEDPETMDEADYVIMESTYGDRTHGEEEYRNKEAQLEEVIAITAKKGGNLVIPAFAVERTQDLLYHLARLEEKGRLYGMEIVIDSPLAINATEIFCKYPEYYDEDATEIWQQSGACPIIPKSLKVARSTEESMALNEITGGQIIISSSGMCDAGRIKHHLKHNLWRKECSVLFVGFLAPGTLGRRIQDGTEKVRIHGEEIKVEADIFSVRGFSAHADVDGLFNWVKEFSKKPERIFVVHGEPEAAQNLANLIGDELGIKTEVPNWLDEYDLTVHQVKTVEVGKGVNAGYIKEYYAEMIQKLNELVYDEIQNERYAEVEKLLHKIESNINEYRR